MRLQFHVVASALAVVLSLAAGAVCAQAYFTLSFRA